MTSDLTATMTNSSCGSNPLIHIKTKRTILLGLLSLFLLVSFCSTAVAQRRLSMDITTKQAANGKLLRVERHLYYNSNGNLVVHYTYPTEYYVTSNKIGELSVYQPTSNEVMMMYDKDAMNMMETFMFFASNNYSDLNLTKLGFVRKEAKKENGRVITTYEPTSLEDKHISKVVVVTTDRKPIYSAFYDNGGKIVKKNYYSQYQEYATLTFPTKITQISYGNVGDSVIKREEYTNIKTSDFGSGALFNYTIPTNAKRVNPFDKKK